MVNENFCFLFISLAMDQTVILYDSTFEICFVYERKCRDMMFYDSNFLMEYLIMVSSTLLTGMIIDTIRSLLTGIIVDITFLSGKCN